MWFVLKTTYSVQFLEVYNSTSDFWVLFYVKKRLKMEILRKIMSQYISFMERYISKCEFLSEKEKEMAVDEMKLISFEFKEKYNDLLEAIK